MKIDNKKKVSNYMSLYLIVLVFLFSIITIIGYFDYHLFSGIFFLIVLIVLVYGFLKNQFVLEYENSGQVISIKNYQWLSYGNKRPVFEMPQKRIIRVEIRKRIFRKYLIIFFSNSSDKLLRKNIDITFCNENETNKLLVDITNNLADKKSKTDF